MRRNSWTAPLLLAFLFAPAAEGSDALSRRDRSPLERPWLDALAQVPDPSGLPGAETEALESSSGPTPFVAGLLSAVLPGTGQLLQKQSRGWLYLGVETAAWFTYFALQNAGDQGEEDFQQFADSHWTWMRYETVTTCEGGGPQNFEEEKQALQAAGEDDFYEDIGREDVYACGWDEAANRTSYQSMRDESDSFYSKSRVVTGVLFLNHAVSAVDAARSAARRPQTEVGMRVLPQRGDLAFLLTLDRRF